MQKTKRAGGTNDASTGTTDEVEGIEDVPLANAVMFCGDTKGSIQCFLEEPSLKGRFRSGRDEDAPAIGGVNEGLGEALPPCLVLKRQHGKDQVGSLCILSTRPVCVKRGS